MEERISTEGTPSGGTLGRDQLLTTKLYVPFVKPNLITRPRLTERLNEGTKGKLTLVFGAGGLRQDHVARGVEPPGRVAYSMALAGRGR